MQFAEMTPISYDYLVLGLGAEVNFFGVAGAAEHAFPLYTLADAARLKEHILERWEAADRDPGLAADGALSVVVVGGGPTGIESVGAMAELYRGDFSKDYPGLPQDQAPPHAGGSGQGAVSDVQVRHPHVHPAAARRSAESR